MDTKELPNNIFCIPVNKEKENIWSISDKKYGEGAFGSVWEACKYGTDCAYVIKITLESEKEFLEDEVFFQQGFASLGFSPPVIDYWWCDNPGSGAIIMERLDMTVYDFIKNSNDENINRCVETMLGLIAEIHDAGLYHGDLSVFNVMLKGVNNEEPNTFTTTKGNKFRIYVIDVQRAGSLANDGSYILKSDDIRRMEFLNIIDGLKRITPRELYKPYMKKYSFSLKR